MGELKKAVRYPSDSPVMMKHFWLVTKERATLTPTFARKNK